jgi:penicillin-binding protein 1A
MRIEKMLSKDEILELYLNKSFFGNRAYGIAAAAEYYYGKPVKELSLLETATLVSSLKFPSSGNPISNPERNRQRSMYVVDRMLEDGYITPAQAQQARAEPPHAAPHEPPVEFYAPYVAEMVRQEMLSRYGEDVFNRGYHVYTTIDADAQAAADRAIIDGLSVYDHRHGWHGVERHVEIPGDAGTTELARHLAGIPAQGALLPAIVADTASDGNAHAVLANGSEITLKPRDADWLSKSPAALLARGDIIRVRAGEAGRFVLDQVPRAQAALVSIDADTGALRALVGGYNYAGNKFNRATQARRQPGSSFKPFVYAASFDKGFNPASIVLDAPVMFRDRVGHTWQPQTTMANSAARCACAKRWCNRAIWSPSGCSTASALTMRANTSAATSASPRPTCRRIFRCPRCRVVDATVHRARLCRVRQRRLAGDAVVHRYRQGPRRQGVIQRGSGHGLPWLRQRQQQCRCHRIGQRRGRRLQLRCSGCAIGHRASQARHRGETERDAGNPQAPAARRAPLVADPRTMYQLVSMMRDVVLRGTGTAAKVLGREDIGGKTGSTNNHRDAWFSGFGGPYATTVWVGRDDFVRLATANTAARPRCRSGSTTCEWP